jgi:hypothetical protein
MNIEEKLNGYLNEEMDSKKLFSILKDMDAFNAKLQFKIKNLEKKLEIKKY